MTIGARFRFEIPIGDWLSLGHGHCEYIDATSELPIESVRAAYLAAREAMPLCCPEHLSCSHQNPRVPEPVRARLHMAGAPVPAHWSVAWTTRTLAEVVAWYINVGNPICDVRLEPAPPIDVLHFHGDNAIQAIGYDMFGDDRYRDRDSRPDAD